MQKVGVGENKVVFFRRVYSILVCAPEWIALANLVGLV